MTKKRKRSAKLPAWAAEQSPDAVLITSANGRIQYVNAAFEALTGFSRAEVLGRTPAVLKSGQHDARFYRRLWRAIRAGRPFRGVFLNRRKSGELFYEEEIIRPVRGPGGRIAYFVSSGRDVSVRERELEKAQHDASHDSLTALPNRGLFVDRLGQALRHAARHKEKLAVAIVDLDEFRRANDTFGHLGGDEVLRTVARRTRRAVRKADTVARIGGDEFALVLAGIESRAAAAAVLEKVRAVNAAPVRYGRARIPLSVSTGACLYPRDGRGEKTLRRCADAAMYEAKRAGGNRWRFARSR